MENVIENKFGTMEIEQKIGENLKIFRKAKGLTIAQLSEITKISRAQLSRIENGKTSSPASTLDIICKALGTKIGFLFDDNTEEDPKVVVTKKNKRIRFRSGMREFGYKYEAVAPQKKNKLMEPFVVRNGSIVGKGRKYLRASNEKSLMMVIQTAIVSPLD